MKFAALLLPLALSACGQDSLESCMADAASKPTELGVRLAAAQCAKQFPKPPNAFDQFDAK